MKRTLIIALLIIASVSAAFSQLDGRVKYSGKMLNPAPGYIMINELTGGIGLGDTGPAYSKGFFGFTTIHGYQFNEFFILAAGTGVSFYNEGTLAPLFLDFRWNVYVSQWTPYLFGDGGLMLDFSDKKDTRFFVNPGAGCRYTVSNNLAVNLGVGLFTQFGDARDSYLNFKTGVTYKF